MSNVISGTKAKRGMQQVGRPSSGGQSRIRCKCGSMAVPTPDGKGGTMIACPTCKNKYVSKPIDG